MSYDVRIPLSVIMYSEKIVKKITTGGIYPLFPTSLDPADGPWLSTTKKAPHEKKSHAAPQRSLRYSASYGPRAR